MLQELRTTLPNALDYSVRTWPDRVALRQDNERTTYAELGQRVESMARRLASHGVDHGDHVAYLMGVSRAWVEVFFGALKLGAIVVPLNLTWTAEELVSGLSLTDASILIVGDDHRGRSLVDVVAAARMGGGLESAETGPMALTPTLRRVLTIGDHTQTHPWAEPLTPVANAVGSAVGNDAEADDRAMLLLTSGSTSFPKPAIHTHASMLAGIVSYADGLEVTSNDVFVHTTPAYHVGGIITMVAPLLRGSSTRLTDWFEPERTMKLIEGDRATLLWGFETHFNALRQDPSYGTYDLSSISRTMVAANPAAATRIREMGFPHIGSLYGSTEYMGSQAFFPYRDRFDEARMVHSHGRPLTAEIRIIDPDTKQSLPPLEVGEICVRGPALFAGYYKMPEETSTCMDKGGFFHSGDMGFLDAQGYLYYRGRYKEVIKTGGENVSAAEVEQFLQSSIPGIRRVVVVGVPDARWGEAVVAVVEPDDDMPSAKEIRALCRARLAGYKVPKQIVLIDGADWRISPTGKMDRRYVLELALENLGYQNLD